jgi:hypothetical protein
LRIGKICLGHKSGRITTHYSAAEIGNLIAAANKVCRNKPDFDSPALTLLRCRNAGDMSVRIRVGNNYVGQKINTVPTKSPRLDLGESGDYDASRVN